MTPTPSFETLAFANVLSLIEDRSAALRAAVAASPDLDARVPSCPDWSLRELVEHLTEVHRFWTAAVAAGPSEQPPAVKPVDDALSAGLLARSATATEELIATLRAAGPELGCWTWWAGSEVPMTSGAVARHQVQEAAVHAFDAQLTAGTPEPLPELVALDGIGEFIGVSHGTAGPWPHQPVRVGLHAEEGESWVLELGAVAGTEKADAQEEDAGLHGPASDLLLVLHGRLPLDRLRTEGDRSVLERLLSWPDLD
ncbi:maleylpyruvate isomerase family mycothiol-dependent enzyme [Kitasatospora azatica]|uniref:maleylpyruvate isomerase family mycothiol-dependent enzyme n=1 Tax=Kitasatospora azatica TaxID=58347 RepID=UPI00055D0377|nr:maleylpyruvate isomerase family mycothiol-dependent enzyme [Kitasatospora azatica]